jgi:ketosteroid isomerase-like protein
MLNPNAVTEAVKAFKSYAKDFNYLDAEKIFEYYHPDAIIMDEDRVVAIGTPEAVKMFFTAVFQGLKDDKFKESTLESLHVNLVSANQAIMTGAGTRYREDGSIIKHFGLTYTLRQVDEYEANCQKYSWKIICGVLHDSNEFVVTGSLK